MPVPASYLDLALLALVGLAAATDLASRRIPNRLLLAGVAGAFLLHLGAPAPAAAVLWGLAGAATGLLLFLPLYCLRGMAAGDVKLLAAVGAFATPLEVAHIALATVCVGGLMALAVVIARGRLRALLVNVGCLLRPWLMRLAGMPALPEPMPGPSVGNIPYGVAIAIGTALFVAQRWIGTGPLPLLL
jgi:prepilin peptidase CpaA